MQVIDVEVLGAIEHEFELIRRYPELINEMLQLSPAVRRYIGEDKLRELYASLLSEDVQFRLADDMRNVSNIAITVMAQYSAGSESLGRIAGSRVTTGSAPQYSETYTGGMSHSVMKSARMPEKDSLLRRSVTQLPALLKVGNDAPIPVKILKVTPNDLGILEIELSHNIGSDRANVSLDVFRPAANLVCHFAQTIDRAVVQKYVPRGPG